MYKRAFSLVVVATILLAMMPVGTAGAVPALAKNETRLTVSPGDEYDPAISGDIVVYTSNRAGNSDVWYYDLATGTEHQVTSGPQDEELADVSGSVIVYTNLGTADIIVYDIRTGEARNLTADSAAPALYPAICGELVVWEDRRDGNAEIYGCNLLADEVRRITACTCQDLSPSVDGDRVAWGKCISTDCDMWCYDWSSGIATRLTETPAAAERRSDLSGAIVTYDSLRDSELDVFAYDLVTASERRLRLSDTQCNPNISGDFICFESAGIDAIYHLMLWHLPTDQVFPLTNEKPGGQYLNDIDMVDATHGRVIYTDDRDGQLDIYMTEFELQQPRAEVTPAEIQFGSAALGASAPAIATIQNTGPAPLTVEGVSLDPTAPGVSITSVPGLPAVVAPGGFIEVGLTFAPTALGTVSGSLRVATDDPANAVTMVPVSGTGVSAENPPEVQIADLLRFYQSSIAGGSLSGTGPGKSAANRAKALENMIEATGDLIRQGAFADAIQQLRDIAGKCDGAETPPDFVTGTARSSLSEKVLALCESLER